MGRLGGKEIDELIKWAEADKNRTLSIDAAYKYGFKEGFVFTVAAFVYDQKLKAGKFVESVKDIDFEDLKEQKRKDLLEELKKLEE